MTVAPASAALEAAAGRKNRANYDHAAGEVWRTLVYEPVHGGWEFANMGGRRILDYLGRRARLGPESRVLELCAGTGACCVYLARRHGCHATGVELNARQVGHARVRLRQAPPAVARRVRVVRGDVAAWRSPHRYDAVFALDSLMLVPDLPATLAHARAALAPGGVMVVAEMIAGPRLDPALRVHAWEEDGILHLPTPEEYRALLRDAGFASIRIHDVTHLAVRCWERVLAAAQARGPECGGWAASARLYRDAFRDGVFRYARITAAPDG
jgi:SAM-dependent methyltransferase